VLTLSSDTKKGNPDPVAHATPRTDDARSKSALIRSDAQQRTGPAEITDPSPPTSTALRTADRAYQAALDDLTLQAGLAT